MTIPTAPPPATPSGEQRLHRSERFFAWVSGAGIARTDGWLGGVAAGIAARLRIDPLIVRGVLVVAALFGLPVVFLYAAAWALLPDLDGRIHARDLLHRRFESAQVGILAMAIIGLLPAAPFTGQLFGFGFVSWSALSAFAWIVGLVLVGGLLFLIVRAARRTPGAPASSPTAGTVDSAAPGASDTLGGSGTAAGVDASPTDAGALATAAMPTGDQAVLLPPAPPALPGPPTPPAPLGAGTQTPQDLEAWRAQHAAWREQDQAWRRQQQDAERIAKDALRHERQTVAAAFAAEAAERRRQRRASHPRAGFAYVSAVGGAALAGGAIVGLTAGPQAGALGLLTAALVLAVGMIVAGLLRRRSGFLAFLAVIALVGGLIAGGASAARDLTFGWAYVSNEDTDHVRQVFGALALDVVVHDGTSRPVVIEKGAGDTEIVVQPGARLDLKATMDSGTVTWERRDRDGTTLDSGRWQPSAQSDGTGTVVRTITSEGTEPVFEQSVTLTQTTGDLRIVIIENAEDQQ